jgi:hypothetical protein
MAMDYFIGYSMADKLALLQGITESLLTGQITRVKTSRDSETEFSPNVDNSLMYQRLCDSIADDPNYDATDPIQLAAYNNQRPSSTRVNFGGGFNGGRNW